MAQSQLAPICSKCASYTRVTNTLYEQGSYNIIRQRTCRNWKCGHTFYTRQAQEEVLSEERVEWPQKFRGSAGKVVRVVPTAITK